MPRNIALLALIPLLAGCWPWILEADPRERDPDVDDTSDPDDTDTPPLVVGPDGGVFTVGSVTLTVPEGAVDDEVTLTLTRTDRDAPEPWVQMSPIWELSPAGLTFDPPATLTIGYTAVEGFRPSLATPGEGVSGYRPDAPSAVTDDAVDVALGALPSELFIGDPTLGFDVFAYEASQADLLFVIDDSCSMSDKQSQLSQQLPVFFAALNDSSIEWRAGVISTDVENNGTGSRGRLVGQQGDRWVDWSSPTPVATLSARVMLGTNGSANEQGLAAVQQALDVQRDSWNAGFFRDDAHLAVYVLSDEQDYSPANLANNFNTWFGSVAPLGGSSFHAIVGVPQGGGGFNCFSDPGTRYLDASAASNGTFANICNYNDWPIALNASALRYLPAPMALGDVPDVETLTVELTESTGTRALTEDEWRYLPGENALLLRQVRPEDGATVTVRYQRAL